MARPYPSPPPRTAPVGVGSDLITRTSVPGFQKAVEENEPRSDMRAALHPTPWCGPEAQSLCCPVEAEVACVPARTLRQICLCSPSRNSALAKGTQVEARAARWLLVCCQLRTGHAAPCLSPKSPPSAHPSLG